MPTPADPAAQDAPADHAAHDRVLVAAYAAGDATGTDLEAAIALVAACTACAALHHDLRLITAALPEIPAPRRTRDFRLTPQQAASLRPAGWRRLLAPFAGPRFAFAAPLGSGLAALGIAGILLAGTGLPLGGATPGAAESERGTTNGAGTATVPVASAPSPGDVMMAQDASPAPVAALAPGASDAAGASADPQLMAGTAGQPTAGAGPEGTAAKGRVAPETPVLPVASLVGLVGLVAGILLVLLRFAGRSAVRTP